MNNKETKIIIAGFGGQGVVLAGNIIARACVIEDKHVTGMVSYGVEMRGGTANATVIVSDTDIASPFFEIPNLAIILNQPSLDKFQDILEIGSCVIVNSTLVTEPVKRDDLSIANIEATQIARDLGDLRVANIVALGAFVEKTKLLKLESLEMAIKDLFSEKKKAMVDINIKALKAGADNVKV